MHMEVRRTLVSLLLATLGGSAMADDRNLQVTARVAPRHPAPQALATLPIPPGSRSMTAGRFGGSYHYAGEAGTAAHFYRHEMPRLGYRLVRTNGDGSELTWEDAHARIELRFRRALGSIPTTRIVVAASARR